MRASDLDLKELLQFDPARRNPAFRERTGAAARSGGVGGNRTQAAAKLGIGAATLYRKLKQYGESARSQ